MRKSRFAGAQRSNEATHHEHDANDEHDDMLRSIRRPTEADLSSKDCDENEDYPGDKSEPANTLGHVLSLPPLLLGTGEQSIHSSLARLAVYDTTPRRALPQFFPVRGVSVHLGEFGYFSLTPAFSQREKERDSARLGENFLRWGRDRLLGRLAACRWLAGN